MRGRWRTSLSASSAAPATNSARPTAVALALGRLTMSVKPMPNAANAASCAGPSTSAPSPCLARRLSVEREKHGQNRLVGRADGAQNTVTGRIHRRMFHGDFIQYVVDWPAGQLIVRRPPTELFAEGGDVTISFEPAHCVLL